MDIYIKSFFFHFTIYQIASKPLPESNCTFLTILHISIMLING